MNSEQPFEGFLLVGGQGRRLGGVKATRDFRGRPLWSYGYGLLQELCVRTTLLGHCPELPGPQRVEPWPGQGPLAAILHALEISQTPWNLILALDYPLLTPELLGSYFSGRDRWSLPQGHPLCGFYHRQALEVLRPAWEAGERSIMRALIPEEGWWPLRQPELFRNCNRPQDFEDSVIFED